MIKRMLAGSTTTTTTAATGTASSARRGGEGFDIRTPLGRATGASGRYALDAVRVLPLPGRGGGRANGKGNGNGKGDGKAVEKSVVLEASDGHQAVCLVTPGKLTAPGLVPAGVLPTRRHNSDVVIERRNGDWRSSEGKVAPVREDATDDASRAFPPITEVLPKLDAKGQRARGPKRGDAAPLAIALDLAVLKKVADALGTLKLTLVVPPPPPPEPEPAPAPPPEPQAATASRPQPASAGPASGGNGGSSCIRHPIGVCPAGDESGVRGIGVVMPLQAEHDHRYFHAVCEQVRKAEQRHVVAGRSAATRNGAKRNGSQRDS